MQRGWINFSREHPGDGAGLVRAKGDIEGAIMLYAMHKAMIVGGVIGAVSASDGVEYPFHGVCIRDIRDTGAMANMCEPAGEECDNCA